MTSAQVIIEKLQIIQNNISTILEEQHLLEDKISQNEYLDGSYGRANAIANRLYQLEIWFGEVQRDLAPVYRNRLS